ncbi:MAG TPA: cytochrome P460 family protein [Opitutaceae bacterium]|nr:cytochrome P460 family protein [Opitutaceae bacterium]
MKTPRIALLLGLLLVSSLLALESGVGSTPGGAERVPLPRDYQTTFVEVRASNQTAQGLLGTIYASPAAAAVRELASLSYPDGSVFVMEWAQPVKGANGEPLVDANGNWQKGVVVRLDVMRREKGFGAAYGDKRAGEWEFASYGVDGSPLPPPPTGWASCAACHAKAAARDFVFRGRFPAIDSN